MHAVAQKLDSAIHWILIPAERHQRQWQLGNWTRKR